MFNKGPQVGHCLSLSVHGTMLYQLCFWDILADNVLKILPDSTEDLSIWTAKKNQTHEMLFLQNISESYLEVRFELDFYTCVFVWCYGCSYWIQRVFCIHSSATQWQRQITEMEMQGQM